MGRRANYVLIEGGRPEIYYSRWGALSIPAVLLSGPEATIGYVRALKPDDDLMDQAWAEGGLALHVDQREVRFYGGGRIEATPYLRRPLLRALLARWPGWNIEWARFGIADLAMTLGWNVSRVLDTEFDDPALLYSEEPTIQEDAIHTTRELEPAQSVLSVRWSERHVADYLLTNRITAVLSFGPRLLHLLANEPAATLPREDALHLRGEGAFVDAPGQALWMWEISTLDPRHLSAMARRWPGWQVHGHVEGLARQVELSGRDPSVVMVAEERAISELVEELAGDEMSETPGLFAVLARNDPSLWASGGAASAEQVEQPPLSIEERRALILRLLRAAQDAGDSAPPAS